MNNALHETLQIEVGKETQMSAGIIDSQSTKMHEGGEERGFNAGKKATGRKRHILVDTLGLALLVLITAVGDMLDRDGAKLCLQALVDRITGWCRLQPFWADGSYLGCLIDWVRIIFCWTLNIVKKLGDQAWFSSAVQTLDCRTHCSWFNIKGYAHYCIPF